MLLNDLISSIRDLHYSIFRQYNSFTNLRLRGIAKEEIKGFKYSIDELKEVAADLDATFFHLPNISNFTATTKELSLL